MPVVEKEELQHARKIRPKVVSGAGVPTHKEVDVCEVFGREGMERQTANRRHFERLAAIAVREESVATRVSRERGVERVEDG